MRFVISEMVFDIAADERHKIRHHRAESHRSSGEVDTIRILQTAGVGLQAAETAKLQEPLTR